MASRFSWRLFLWRAVLNWRWYVVLPYVLIVCAPVALLITLGEFLDDHQHRIMAPIDWWKSHALRVHATTHQEPTP